MTFNNFKDRLLEVSKCVCDLKDFLQKYVEIDLDEDQYNKYDARIDEVLWDLNNVRIDCEILLTEMRMYGDID